MALWKILQPEVMPQPTEQTWKNIASDYEEKWQFPHCVGSIDGKHILIQAPACSGSVYFNYKKTFTIVLLAVVDARYNFVAVDIGAQGQRSDGSVFSHSIFGKKLRNESLGLPAPSNLVQCGKVPYVFVADEAFPLMPNLMRPYPGRQLPPNERIFNYRLSRARRIVENAFGIMAARFRVFRRPLDVKPETADFVVKACTVLHNYLRKENHDVYMRDVDMEIDIGRLHEEQGRRSDSSGIRPLRRTGRSTSEATAIRELFKNHFISECGALPWQNSVVFQTE